MESAQDGEKKERQRSKGTETPQKQGRLTQQNRKETGKQVAHSDVILVNAIPTMLLPNSQSLQPSRPNFPKEQTSPKMTPKEKRK